jgi:hypothetical protein
MQRLEVSGAVRHIYIYIYVVRQQMVNLSWLLVCLSESIRYEKTVEEARH